MRTLFRLVAVSTGTLLSAAGVTHCQSTCEERGDCNTFTGTGGSGTGATGGTAGTTGGTGTGGTSAGGTGTGGTGTGGDGGGTSGGEGGMGGEGGTGPDPCDPENPVTGCAIADPNGIYVAPSGDDGNDGSKNAPLHTITEAIEQAADTEKTIYVCNSTYGEALEITDSGLVMRSGYTCPSAGTTGWLYEANTRARVRPANPGYALRVNDVTSLTVSDMEFNAPDAEGMGESSVAVFVTSSEGVSFSRTRIVAGDGMSGEDGVLGGTNHFQMSLDGSMAVGVNAGGGLLCTCPDKSTSTGAVGGAGGVSTSPGGVGEPDYGTGGGTRGEAGTLTKSCTNGGLGSPAPARSDAMGALTSGSVSTANGWIPASGEAGLNGQTGQGGGGGGGALGTGKGGGGGGACGGCGGLGAPAGKGGGGSIGLLALSSNIALDAGSRIDTGNAGSGGSSVAGEDGQTGGTGGNRDGQGCLGGNGGKGATGGAGGGGAGGVSVGILSKGGTIISTDVTFNLGNAGLPGQGGGADNDGVDGVAQDTLEL